MTVKIYPGALQNENLHVAGKKADSGKIRADLLLDFRHALSSVAEVATFGAQKYTEGGWLSVPDAEKRYTAALIRHLLTDSPTDSESGLSHLAHAAWNALAILELELRNKG